MIRQRQWKNLEEIANISRMVEIGPEVELGTGSHIIQGLRIGANSIVGAGWVVIRDIREKRTVAGTPARVIKIDGKRVDFEI